MELDWEREAVQKKSACSTTKGKHQTESKLHTLIECMGTRKALGSRDYCFCLRKYYTYNNHEGTGEYVIESMNMLSI